MENKAHALAAGAFVLGLVAVLVALVVWLTRDDTVRNTFELSTRDPVSGLQPQAMVRYRGIAVGKVASIDFDPKIKGNVRVRITVDERVPLTTSSFATLSYQGVTGLAFIALDDKGESQEPLTPDNKNPPRIPLKPSLLSQLQDRGEALIGKVDEVTKRVGALLNEENQKRVADALEGIAQAAAGANQLTKSLDNMVKNGLNPALKALPPLVERTKDTMASVKTAAGDVSRVTRNLNNSTSALSEAVGSFNTGTLPRLNRVAEDTSATVRRLGRTADNINDNPQSLLFGPGAAVPGPGEPGFSSPAASSASH
jgi:phospholipid/cholesterol/gamma-HCH transport system substrate-binding protein